MARPTFLEDFQGGQDLLRHYDLLQGLGILDHLERLSGEVRDLETLMEEAEDLVTKETAEDLIEYLSQKLLAKAAPGFLVFVYEENPSSNIPNVLVYRNMRRTTKLLSLPSFEPYKHFFSLCSHSLNYDVFVYMIDRPALTDPFSPFQPQRILPVISFGKPIGFILIGRKVVGGDYTDKELRYMERLISFGSIALQNTLHYQRAILDFKTGLYNHSFLIQRMDEEIARIKRYQAQLAILIMDVDHFKHFNDIHGHLAGDAILAHVAEMIKKCIRIEDIASRFGGDEFVVMLIQCNQNYGWLIAERIRRYIQEAVLEYDGKKIGVTVSIGVTYCSSVKPVPDSATLIQKADKALYVSKEKGRNQTSVYQGVASSS